MEESERVELAKWVIEHNTPDMGDSLFCEAEDVIQEALSPGSIARDARDAAIERVAAQARR